MKNIKAHFTNKGLGDVDSICGDLGNLHPCVFFIKNKYYAVMLMPTYGGNERVGEESSVNCWREDNLQVPIYCEKPLTTQI